METVPSRDYSGATYGDVTYERSPVTERWVHWPVYWTPIWVGVLTALGVALLFGLIALATGAQTMTPGFRIARWRDIGFGALFFSVFGAFLAFAAGGWVASRVAGIRRSEPAMLHGAIVFLVALPFLVVFAALGAGNFFGAWFHGLAGMPAWVVPAPTASGTAVVVDPVAAAATRNAALTALTALLLGLVGAVVGGWAASGEPMTFTHYRTRTLHATGPAATTVTMPPARVA